MLNPYVILAIVVGWGSSIVGAGYWAYGAGQDKCIAEQARDVAVAQIASEEAAKAIAKIKIQHTTVRQATETIINEKPVYRDCRSDDELMRLYNSAIPSEQAANPSKLPASNSNH